MGGAMAGGGAFFGSVGASASSNIIQNLMSYFSAKELASDSWKRQKSVLQNRIKWAVLDMKGAGLNPLLAVSGGVAGGAGSAPMGVAHIGGGGNIPAGAVDLMETFKRSKFVRREYDRLINEAEMLRARGTREYWEGEVAREMRKNVIIDREAKMTDLALKRMSIPGALTRMEMDKSEPGKWITRVGHAAKQISPLLPSYGGHIGYGVTPDYEERETWKQKGGSGVRYRSRSRR